MKSYLTDILKVIDRRSLIELSAISFLLTIFEAVSVSAIIPVVNVILGGGVPSAVILLLTAIGVISPAAQVMVIIVAVAAVFLARGFFLSGIVYLQSKLVFNIQKRLSNLLLDRYVSAKFECMTDIASSTLVRTSTTELGNITHGVLLPLSTLTSELALVAGSLLVLFALQPMAALILIGAIFAFSAPIYWLNRQRLSRLGRIRHDMEENRVKLAQELVSGGREIKVYGLEAQLKDAVARTNNEYSRVLAQSNFLQNFPRIYFEALGVSTLLLVCAFQISRGTSFSDTLMFLTVSAFAAFRALPSVAKVLSQFQSVRFYRPSLTSYLKLLDDLQFSDAAESKGFATDGIPRQVQSLRIVATNVSYRHKPNSSAIFSNLSLDISSGQIVGLVGVSGVGKSTLLDCLIGLRTPSSGTVVFLDSVSGEPVRPRVSYVPQTPVMFDASIFRNITLSQLDEQDLLTSNAELIEALEISGFAAIMETRQLNLLSKVVEGGRNLSGGQRQRLALARALYRNSDILVLDEATSALDKDGERAMLEQLRTRRPEQLIIMVTHKPELLDYCDKVIHMQVDGRINIVC